MGADKDFEKLFKEAFDKFLKKNPGMATQIGLHDPYDKLLPDGSRDGVFENLKLLKEWRDKMRETIDFGSLNDDHKMDWKAIEHAYDLWKFSIDEHRLFETNPDAFYQIGGVIFIMVTRDYASLEKRIEGIVSRLKKLPKYLEQFRTRFEKSQPVKLWTEIAIESCQRIPSLFQFIAVATKGKISDELHGRFEKTIGNLSQPIREHLEWLKNLLPKAKLEWALGKEKFDRLLEIRKLGMIADEIYELGVKYLKEMKEERHRLAKEFSPEKTVEEVMSDIEKDAPATFEEALKATQEQMEKARRFVIENDLATVDEEGRLLVKETPSFIAPLIPFAALIPSAKFDKTQEGIYIVTRPSDMKNLGKHLNYPTIRNTAVHEGFPGHFLQGVRSNRASIIRMLPVAAGGGIETIEGWAHYCEQMMMERGFDKSLETRLVQVNDIIWRAVRIIVDVKLSRGEMGFDEAVDMLVKEVGMSKEGAVAEVRRYTQTPGYALSYLLGKHLILKLREEVTGRMGDKYNEKFFHDTITANGALPISQLREVFERKLA